jgi:hypothetical protein
VPCKATNLRTPLSNRVICDRGGLLEVGDHLSEMKAKRGDVAR